jgi:hypothetical protein
MKEGTPMSRRARRMLTLALLVGALPLLTIACPFLMLKLDVKNDMDSNQTLVEFNLSPEDDSTWGDNQLSGDVPPGAMATISHISPGSYDYRAIFESKEGGTTEVAETTTPLTFGTLNICLTYFQYTEGDEITSTIDVEEVL